MSETGPPTDPRDQDEALAAEHALGVLDAPERAVAERRELADPAFAARVEGWRTRLAVLLDQIKPVTAPEEVWPRIIRSLGGVANVVELRLRRSLRIWQGVASVAAAAALVLAFAAFTPRREGPTPVMTSQIATADKGPVVYVAMMDPAHHRIILQPVAMTATPGRSPELWLIGTDGKPLPLGVAEFARPVELKLDKAPTGKEVLAVSIEPQGGSPTGLPTGPVVATGKLQLL